MGLPNAYPYEVMGAPHSLYIATFGTARPALNVADPTGVGWTLIGLNGNKSYAEEGVRVNSPAAYNFFRGYGSAAPLKAFRSEEDVMCQVVLADMTLESLALGFNKLSSGVTEVGITRTLGLSRGLGVMTMALLVRGPSPYMDDGIAQFWIPVAANVSAVELALRRDNGTAYGLEFRALYYADATAGEEMGVYEAEDETT
jgi:hypothetical protein